MASGPESKNAVTEEPAWFKAAIADKPEKGEVEVQGVFVRYLHWPNPEKPGLLLVHGHSASADWWRFIAPLLKADYNIAAIHLTGMGDSEWREAYRQDVYAEELIAVCDAAGLGDKPTIAAHSFGAGLALMAGATFPDKVGGIILLDSGVRPPSPHGPRFAGLGTGGGEMASKPEVVFENRDDGLERFRLTPPQPCDNHYILDFIAENALEDVDDGWSWKTDPDLGLAGKQVSAMDNIKNLQCRLGLIGGQLSAMFTSDVVEYMRVVLGGVPITTVPEARHHLMIDQPLAFVAALRTMLADWTYSDAHPRRDVSEDEIKEAAKVQLAVQQKRDREEAKYR